MEKYKKIIDIEYPKSNRRKHMSLNDRAAQFAPFAALTGYEESLQEVLRPTTPKKNLTQEDKDIISAKLNFIITNKLKENITITYFIPDLKKKGGKYETVSKEIKRIDEVNKTITFIDSEVIEINKVIDITSKTLEFIFIDF